MPTKAALEQEITDTRRVMTGLEEEIKAIRVYIASNEHVLQGQPESLRSITQESLAKARANLARKEQEHQAAQQSLLDNQKVLVRLDEIDKKQHEIRKLEQDLDTITNLLEKARADLVQLEADYLAVTAPVVIPGYDLVFTDGRRLSLPPDRAELLVGCVDQADRIFPDLDLTPFSGRTSGVSRRHATLRFMNNQWTITDLGSANGTFVNEVAIAPNTPTIIHDQVKLRFGALQVVFRSMSPSKTMRL